MKRSLLLSLLPLTQTFHSKPDEAAGGGGAGEPKTLDDANAEIAKLRSSLADEAGKVTAAHKERDDAQAEVQKINGQFSALQETAKAQKADLDKANAELATANSNFVAEQKKSADAQANITRLESLVDLKGVDRNASVPTAGASQPVAKLSMEDWDKKIAAAKTPKEVAAVTADFEKAVKEGQIK